MGKRFESGYQKPNIDQHALEMAMSAPAVEQAQPQTTAAEAEAYNPPAAAQGGTGGAVTRPGNQGQLGHITNGGTKDATLQGMGTAGYGNAQNGMKNFMHGFDANNYNDPKMNSVKYRFGRMASDANANTPQAMAALVASQNFQNAFKGATFDGKDKVNFNGALSDGDHGTPVGMIDVLEGADQNANTANGVWWGWDQGGAENFGGQGFAHGAPGSTAGLPPQTMDDVMGGVADPLSQQLAAQQTGPTSLDELMALLTEQQAQYSDSLRGI